jgi:UDP-glucose 4-epimerase
MKNVIVFGGSGFVGSHVVDALTGSGYSVKIFDLKEPGYINNNANFIKGDITDEKAVSEAIKGMDIVYNFAGLADIDKALNMPVETVKLNILGNVHILEACRKFDIKRFVYASTVYVFSETGGFYRCSKQACEQYILEYQKKYGLNFTILRYGTLYGTRADERNSVYRYIKQALLEKKITYYGGPDYIREYIHVEDAARLSAEILSDDFKNEYVILTGHHPITIKNLFEMIREMLGYDVEIEYLPAPAHHYKVTPYSFNPKLGRKLISRTYYDMGQGLLKCLQEINKEVQKDEK